MYVHACLQVFVNVHIRMCVCVSMLGHGFLAILLSTLIMNFTF